MPFFEIFEDQMLKENEDGSYNFYHLLYLFRILRVYKAAQLLEPSYVFQLFKKLHQFYLKHMFYKHNKNHDY